MTETDHYPSPKEALFGNGHIANLRCAIKWFVWQGGYALLAVVGLVALALYTVYSYLKKGALAVGSRLPTGRAGGAVERGLSPIGRAAVGVGSRIHDGWVWLRENDYVVLGAMLVFAAALGVAAIVATGFVLWFILMNPITYLAIIGAVAHVGVFLLGWAIYTEEREKTVSEMAGKSLSKAGNKAKETPGVRRVYGNCPVHWSLEPKWFDKLASKFE